MKKEYLVNEIAKMFNVSKRTLQYYDKIDLLKPAYIKDNGYRIYTEDELVRLIEIIIWKNVGLESSEIKSIFFEKTPENIAEKLHDIDRKLDEELKRIHFLKENIRLIKESFNHKAKAYKGVKVKSMEIRTVSRLESSGSELSNLSEMMVQGVKILRQTIVNKIPFVEFGFVFSKDKKVSEDYLNYTHFFFTLPTDYKTDSTTKFEGGKYACMWYEGDLVGISEGVKKLVKWINDQNYEIQGDIIYSESFSSLYYSEPEKTDGEIQIRII